MHNEMKNYKQLKVGTSVSCDGHAKSSLWVVAGDLQRHPASKISYTTSSDYGCHPRMWWKDVDG